MHREARMEMYDLLMLAILIVAILFGAMKGIAWQLASAAALFGSYVVAMLFHEPVSRHVNAEPPWNEYLAMFLLYMGTSFVVWLCFALVRRVIDKVHMRDFDRQAGAIVGAANGAALCLIVTFFAVTLPFLTDDQKTSISRSRSGYVMAAVVDRVRVGMPDDVDRAIRPYLDRLESGLEQHGRPRVAGEDSGLAGDDDGGFGDAFSREFDEAIEGKAGSPWNGLDWKRLAEELKRGAGTR